MIFIIHQDKWMHPNQLSFSCHSFQIGFELLQFLFQRYFQGTMQSLFICIYKPFLTKWLNYLVSLVSAQEQSRSSTYPTSPVCLLSLRATTKYKRCLLRQGSGNNFTICNMLVPHHLAFVTGYYKKKKIDCRQN